MVDATGSMGDEMNYLKVELTDVIAKVKTKNPTATINMGAVFYRDNGDDYVTRKSDEIVSVKKQNENYLVEIKRDFKEGIATMSVLIYKNSDGVFVAEIKAYNQKK